MKAGSSQQVLHLLSDIDDAGLSSLIEDGPFIAADSVLYEFQGEARLGCQRRGKLV